MKTATRLVSLFQAGVEGCQMNIKRSGIRWKGDAHLGGPAPGQHQHKQSKRNGKVIGGDTKGQKIPTGKF